MEVRVLSPRPRGTSELENAAVSQTVLAGFDPLVPYHPEPKLGSHAGVAQWQEAAALEAVQCGFDSLHRYQFRNDSG